MKVTAKLNNLRIAPRKIRLVTDMVAGLDVDDALNQLNATVKSGMRPVQKLLSSAISNGENNFGIDRNNMYVYKINVEAGPTLKRWMPKAYGRAGRILKRTSGIELILDERVEGKDRKSREQLEKEKKTRMESKRREEKKAQEKMEAEKKAAAGSKKEAAFAQKEKVLEKSKNPPAGGEKRGGLTSRIFRRKSM